MDAVITWPYLVGNELTSANPGKVHKRSHDPGFVLRPARLPDPAEIPPRQWLYGRDLARDFVTILAATGGTGKSAFAMTVAIELASGRALLSTKILKASPQVCRPIKVAILNLEDPLDELERRVAGIMKHYEINRNALNGQLFLHSGEMRALTIAAVGDDGSKVIYPDENVLIDEMRKSQVDLVIVDPLAESHSLEENSNGQMALVAAAWRRVARATNAAVWLIHHVRKGGTSDIEGARGAKSLTDSARIGIMMASMSEEEARQMDVRPADRLQFVRVETAKANMAPRGGHVRWFKLASLNLGNSSAEYPDGDTVGVIESWEPPSTTIELTDISTNQALDIINNGFRPDVPFSPNRSGNGNQRWVGNVLVNHFGLRPEGARRLITRWFQEGVLEEISYRQKDEGKSRKGVKVNHSKRP